jgi:hypothetical protein
VQVHYDEGAATHVGPEPCTVVREGDGEASVGVRIGQLLSRERTAVPGADAVLMAEGDTNGRVNASARSTRRGRRPWHVWMLPVREPGDLASGRRYLAAGPHREGEEP